MDKHAAFIKHLRQVFLQELTEHLAQLERVIVQLGTIDKADYDDVLKQLFRTAHTLKGASRAAQYPEIEHVADKLESLLSLCSPSDLKPLTTKNQLLLQLIDVLKSVATATEPLAEDHPSWQLVSDLTSQLLVKTALKPPVPARPEQSAHNQPAYQAEPSPAPTTLVTDATVKVRSTVLNQLLQLNNDMLTLQQSLQTSFKQLQYWQDDHHSWLSNQPAQPVRELKKLLKDLKQEHRQLNQVLQPLSKRILQTGMAPFALACDALQRAVHDLALQTGKKVQLHITGQSTEFDRLIIDALKDPLLHIIRNAVDHGIEPPKQRRRLAKPETGTLTVSATLRFGGVCISVADDGKGVDPDAIRAKLTASEQALTDEELLQKILVPGFTTTNKLTAFSGRGVGMDVVANTVGRLRGKLRIINSPQQGFEIQLHLPVNLSVLFALEIRTGGQVFFVDTQSIITIHRIALHQLIQLNGNWVLPQATETLNVFSLAALLGLPVQEWSDNTAFPLVELTDGQHRIGILVDELVNEHQINVNPLGDRFGDAKLYSGASLRANGQVALILHSASLIQHASLRQVATPWRTVDMANTTAKKRLLVAEDSVTTRTLMKGILELEGFDVLLAEDGIQAWQSLQRNHVDLLISDVEMPLMDGFELCEQVRKSTRHQHVPIILVTALRTDEDKLKGLHAGANAYIVKSHFEQTELLNAIRQLL